MKKLLSCLFLLSFLQCAGQNEYFEGNPRWGIQESCFWGGNPYYDHSGTRTVYSKQGDTTISESIYVKIFRIGISFQEGINEQQGGGYLYYNIETPFFDTTHYALLRSENKRMYKWNEELNEEQLLYDFDMQVGDTFQVHSEILESIAIVESIDSILLGGEFRKRIMVNAELIGNNEFIEGVGHRFGIWTPNWNSEVCGTGLNCFSLNEDHYIVQDWTYPWLSIAEDSCVFNVPVEQIQDTENLVVFPNPVSNVLQIKNIGNSPITAVRIMDTIGHLVMTGNRQQQIDVSHLPRGIYFIEIISDNILAVQRFVKE